MKTQLRILATVLATTALLAGCSSSPSTTTKSSSPAASSQGQVKITVGGGVGAFMAPLTTDSFAQQGLAITRQPVNSGSAAVPLLLNGQLQFSATDASGALQAISKGVPLKIVATAAVSGTNASTDSTAVLVKNGSPIRSAADLAGKKVAVNAIGNISQLSAAAAIDALGSDSSKVHFVEFPPHAMNDAVAQGAVDAEVTSEPGIVQGQSAGLRTLFSPMSQALPGVPLFVYVTSAAYAAQHPDVVQKFARAMTAANQYAAAHSDFVRAYAQKASNLTAAQAAGFILPQFLPATVDKAGLQKIVDLMTKYKALIVPVDLDKAVWAP